MQIKFKGNGNSIDANTLVSIIVHYQSIANIANEIYSGGEKDIRIKVNGLEKGSFAIDLSVVQDSFKHFFSKNTVEYIAALTGIIYSVFALYKFFKGNPVKSEKDRETAKGIAKQNDEITITIYNQPIIREAISKSIEKADEETSIESFSIINGEEMTTFTKEEFKNYIYDDFDREYNIPDKRAIEQEALLIILGMSFIRGSKWQFMYNGREININVKDDALMKKINEGERFGKGDAIVVTLRIIQTYNRETKSYENNSYKIVDFKEHIVPKRKSDEVSQIAN